MFYRFSVFVLLGFILSNHESPAAELWDHFEMNQLNAELRRMNAGLYAPSSCSIAAYSDRTPQVDGLCGDIYRFTCAPGRYDDGTGVASTSGMAGEKVARVRQQSTPHFLKQFNAALAQPRSDYFKKIALSALGLTYSPACEDDFKAKECTALLAQGLAEVAEKRIFSGIDPSLMGFGGLGGMGGLFRAKARDIDLLIQSPTYQKTEQELSNHVRSQLQDFKIISKLENVIFPDVKKILRGIVQSRVSNEKTMKLLDAKIDAIEFKGTDCAQLMRSAPTDSPAPSISPLLIPNAFYNPESNTFKYCNGFLLGNQSEFQIVSVIAHELTHGVDPCNITKGPSDFRFKYSDPKNTDQCEAEFPFQGLIPCLRGDQSVKAKKSVFPDITLGGIVVDPPADDKMIRELRKKISMTEARIKAVETDLKAAGLTEERKKELQRKKEDLEDQLQSLQDDLAEALSKQKTPAPPTPFPFPFPIPGGKTPPQIIETPDSPFCTGDQIGETFSDWIAAEVLPEYMSLHYPDLTEKQYRLGYSNVFRGSCNHANPEQSFMSAGLDVHPEESDRVNKIILTHPKIRKQMGCDPKPPAQSTYCSPKAPGAK